MSRGGRKSTAQRLASLNRNIDGKMYNQHDRSQWVEICRKTLLDMETRNIHRRAKHWTELVNEKVKDTNSRLSLDESIFSNVTKPFSYKVNNTEMNKHLGFIISWKGLKTRQIQNAPKTYVEFENKAKNWLNGRRAPNYAATLFPDMIKASEIYADYVSRQIFPNNPKHSKMYNKICVIGFLSSLCSARISLNDASKKAYLICENSVKTGKTQVSQILQRYASDHPYQDKFPSHLREASDFFENKYMELISDFGIQLNQKKRQDKLDYANTTGKQVLDHINDSSHSDHDSRSVGSNPSLHSHNSGNRNTSEGGLPSSVTHSIMKDITNCDGNLNAISMSIDQFNQLAKFLSGMITNQRTQQSTINDLVTRVRQLEDQQQKILNDVTSNSPRSMSSANVPPPTYGNDASNGRPPFNAQGSVTSSNQSMNHQQNQPQQQQQNGNNGNNMNNNHQQRQFQMASNPQPGMMQPGSNGNNNSNGFAVRNGNNNNNGNGQRVNVANIANQNIQPRFINNGNGNGQKQNPQIQQLPNQGRLSPANSHATSTTKSTNSIPGAQQFMNRMGSNIQANVMNGMNTNGINMTISNINKNLGLKNMVNNGNNNNNNRMNMQQMNNGNVNGNGNGMVSIPQMNQISNITHNLPVPQMQQVNMNNMNNMNMQQMNQMNQMKQMQQQMRVNNNVNNNQNVNVMNGNVNNQQQLPSIPGAATPSRNMSNGNSQQLQGTNTLNSGGIPTTSLYGVGSYDSMDGDMAMHGFGQNQSFNSSDAGMTNLQSMPNNYATSQAQQPQIPLDTGYMPRFPDANSTMQPALQSYNLHQ